MRILESILINSRFITIFAVVFSMIGAVMLFATSVFDIANIAIQWVDYYFYRVDIDNFHKIMIGDILGAIDIFLLAIVLLIFSFGIYELFIEKIKRVDLKVLEVNSLDNLKDKLAKVIIMVLIVSFFQKSLISNFEGAYELLMFALSLCFISLAIYILNRK